MQGGDYCVSPINPVCYEQSDQMFGERLRPKLQCCKFLQKGFCIAVLSVSSSQQSGQSRCVASTRALLQNPALTRLAT